MASCRERTRGIRARQHRGGRVPSLLLALLAADAMRAVHLPFAVETMGGLSESAQQLIRETHHSTGDHNTWHDAAIIGTHLVDAVAIAVQRCTGMALQKSQWRERQVATAAQVA